MKKVGIPSVEEVARYGTNACVYAAADLPCVVFGPGSISQAHTADEWIDLREVEQATEILKNLVGYSGVGIANRSHLIQCLYFVWAKSHFKKSGSLSQRSLLVYVVPFFAPGINFPETP